MICMAGDRVISAMDVNACGLGMDAECTLVRSWHSSSNNHNYTLASDRYADLGMDALVTACAVEQRIHCLRMHARVTSA